MKLTLTILLFVTVTLNVFAQSPEKMSYQAIIRAQDNTLVTNSNISLKIIVHQGTVSGTNVYEENHSVKTNNNGLVSLEIGTGNIVNGTFGSIAWEKGPYFIETKVDVSGGTNYNIIGVTQLLSVPYALHSITAERLVGNSNTTTPARAVIVPFTSSRSIAVSDINNTIECTTSATLTLTSGFGSMAIGDSINLEAHNGAVLTIQASAGVTINYTTSGNAKFSSSAGNVRFGFLRKSGVNAYIISGQ
ncbi:hypothetical protein [Flavobacterium sp. N3904]|uniref:hypothetical protein n=1 Tax=Flavobacterium sp. N3904 TaxID=2986835 RepID=UPI002223F9F1|nr:hypothetical protein [Flavobacterium sp. N3904]